MTVVWWLAACGLVLNIAFGLGITTTRRGAADSLLALLLFGTAGVALALVVGAALGHERAVDVALVLALLAAVLGVAAVRLGWFGDSDDGSGRS
jgi:multisubunit Na+/H+ antiporter MnhF subunit